MDARKVLRRKALRIRPGLPMTPERHVTRQATPRRHRPIRAYESTFLRKRSPQSTPSCGTGLERHPSTQAGTATSWPRSEALSRARCEESPRASPIPLFRPGKQSGRYDRDVARLRPMAAPWAAAVLRRQEATPLQIPLNRSPAPHLWLLLVSHREEDRSDRRREESLRLAAGKASRSYASKGVTVEFRLTGACLTLDLFTGVSTGGAEGSTPASAAGTRRPRPARSVTAERPVTTAAPTASDARRAIADAFAVLRCDAGDSCVLHSAGAHEQQESAANHEPQAARLRFRHGRFPGFLGPVWRRQRSD